MRHFVRLFSINTFVTCTLLASLYTPVALFALVGLPFFLLTTEPR